MDIDIQSNKYHYLFFEESHIRIELARASVEPIKPKEEVLVWLENVERLKDQASCVRCVSNPSSCTKHSECLIDLSEEVDELTQQISYFASGLFVPDTAVVEQCANRSQLVDMIWENLMDPDVGISSIVGMGGVGKTTAMMKIRNQLATSDIFDTIVWVTVSKDLSLHKVQSDIAMQIELDLGMYRDLRCRASRILERLKKIKKFLIIFDDLWGRIPLEKVGIPQVRGKNGCKVVVISRSLEICHNMYPDKIIAVEVLSKEEAWDLFASKAGDVVFTSGIQPLAREVVQRCLGLPIITISVGVAMRGKVDVEVWMEVLDELTSLQKESLLNCSNPLILGDHIVSELLRFSYNRLSNDKVQNCFLYCALFPEDYFFKPEELIRYWMAEDFVHDFVHETGDIIREIDDGYEILREIQDANMLDVFTNSGDEWLQMHDLFRDLAIKIIKEERGFYFLVKAGLGLRDLSLAEWGVARKISLMRNQIERLHVPPHKETNVTTLLLHDNPISHIHSSFFSQISALKILDISYSWITELPPSLSELAQLRVLFLHYCTRLQRIPSLEKLRELQVLTLCGTSITELPHGMEGLVRLRSLDLSHTTKLKNIRVGMISSLSRLEELRMQGSGLCMINPRKVAKYLIEMRSLKCLAILSLSVVGHGDHLETIMCLQEQSLEIFSINVFGSIEDYIEDMETV